MASLNIKKIRAKSVSYGGTRGLGNIRFTVIHYTGNKGDTAAGNGNYFAHGNTRSAGAHFFVDSKEVVESIPMEYIAYAVGGDHRSGRAGEAKYYRVCTNANSVSIELCDIADKQPTDKQIELTAKLIAYIQSRCPNAKTIIRHYDVNGKSCPATMVDNAKWNSFLSKLKAKGIKSVSINTSANSEANNNVRKGQEWSVNYTGHQISCDGIRGPKTKEQAVRVIQHALNKKYKAGLAEDGDWGPKTEKAMGSHSCKLGDKNELVLAAKIMLKMKGKAGMKYNKEFGSGTKKAAGKEKITAKDFKSYTQ